LVFQLATTGIGPKQRLSAIPREGVAGRDSLRAKAHGHFTPVEHRSNSTSHRSSTASQK
jgi:hypothetical protein